MKGLVGTVVIVGSVVGVVMWALLARYRADLESTRGIDPCALGEVRCASTPSGLVHHATFAATGTRGGSLVADLSVSCVGSVWDVGIAFGKSPPAGPLQRRLGVLRHPVALRRPREAGRSRTGSCRARSRARSSTRRWGRRRSGESSRMAVSRRRSGRDVQRDAGLGAGGVGRLRRASRACGGACDRPRLRQGGGRGWMSRRWSSRAHCWWCLVVSGLLLSLYLVAATGVPRGTSRPPPATPVIEEEGPDGSVETRVRTACRRGMDDPCRGRASARGLAWAGRACLSITRTSSASAGRNGPTRAGAAW